MGIYSACIHGIDSAVTVDIRTSKLITCKQGFSSCVGVCPTCIHGIDSAIAVDIAQQVDLHVLGHGFRAYRNGVLTGDIGTSENE